MVKSLQTICVENVRSLITNGAMTKPNSHLDPVTSELILESLFRECVELSEMEEVTTAVPKILNVKRINLYRKDITENMCNMISGFNEITSLYLEALADWELFHLENPDSSIKTIDLIDVLTRLLSPDSQLTLRVMFFGEQPVKFRTGWTAKIPQILPALKYLDFGKVEISQEEFIEVCTLLLNLENLSVYNIRSLSGISKSKNLKVFRSVDSRFEIKEDLIEVFALKKIGKLGFCGDLSYDLPCLKLYLECKLNLPSLRFFDCSENNISIEDVQQLAESHPMLQTICVLNTSLGETAYLKNVSTKLRLLSLGSLRQCIECFRQFDDNCQISKIRQIIFAMEPFLTVYEQQVEKDIKDCFDQIITFLKYDFDVYTGNASQIAIVNCLNEMCCEGRVEMFSVEVKQELMDFLITIQSKLVDVTASTNLWRLNTIIWIILHNISISTLSKQSKQFLFLKSIEHMGKMRHVLMISKWCINLATDHLKSMPADTILMDEKVVKLMMNTLPDLIKLDRFDHLNDVFQLFKAFKWSLEKKGAMTEKIVMSVMSVYEGIPAISIVTKLKILKVLRMLSIYSGEHTARKIHKNYVKPILIKLLENENNRPLTLHVVAWSIAMYYFIEGKYVHSNKDFIAVKTKIPSIVSFIEIHKSLKTSLNYKDVVSYILSKMNYPLIKSWGVFVTDS